MLSPQRHAYAYIPPLATWYRRRMIRASAWLLSALLLVASASCARFVSTPIRSHDGGAPQDSAAADLDGRTPRDGPPKEGAVDDRGLTDAAGPEIATFDGGPARDGPPFDLGPGDGKGADLPANSTCTSNCVVPCPAWATTCIVDCPLHEQCDVTCPDGCHVECDDDADCHLSCPNDDCTIYCSGGSNMCSLSCSASTCSLGQVLECSPLGECRAR